MRVLTDPAETGAVTLALPQDVQARSLRLSGRVLRETRAFGSTAGRRLPDAIKRAAEADRRKQKPLIIAGGGVHYSAATEALRIRGSVRTSRRRDAGRQERDAWNHPLRSAALA